MLFSPDLSEAYTSREPFPQVGAYVFGAAIGESLGFPIAVPRFKSSGIRQM
jgi:hypothetical protein